MKHTVSLCAVFAFALLARSETFELRKGDHIAIVGNALAERQQHVGWLETLLYDRFSDYDLVVRNLGYAGDELDPKLRLRVEGFGSSEEWLTRVKADVVFAFFGYNESFGGAAGLEKFRSDLKAFLENMRRQRYNGVCAPRVVLFSPIAHENLRDPNLPNGDANNKNLKLYAEVMADVAKAGGVTFVDLFTPTQAAYAQSRRPWTINGVHLNDYGDQQVALLCDAALFGAAPDRDFQSLEKLRAAVRDKNWHWFQLYRVLDGYNVYGGRSHLKFVDGLTNRAVHLRELEVLDVMTANRDKRIWAVAQGKEWNTDDHNTPPFIPVKTNIPGKGPKGTHVFLGGEEAISKMRLQKGLSVNLFASEEKFPELINPVQMAWDTRGRLWVAVWPTYPRWQPKTPMNDKLLIFEDSDGDGRADTMKIFADHLHCPTGFEFWNGGVLIAQAPYLVFLKDTNGDDKADVYERLASHLDSGDTHHTANSFTFDPSGALYWQEGTFHRSQIESPYGPPRRLADAGAFRYDPRTQRLDTYITYAFANPHGHVFDRWGEDIITDGTMNTHYYAPAISGQLDYPAKHPNLQTIAPQRTRPGSATEILSSRHFPDEMQGNFLALNVIGFLGIQQFQLAYNGAGITATEVDPILYSTDPNFRPSDVEIGPDGAIYFLDWHNPIIGHMQHHLRDPNRDRAHGRIYRVTHESRPLLRPPKIAGESIPKLLELLKEPENRVRYRAKIELSSRDSKAVVAALDLWVKKLDASHPDYEHHMTEALWTYQWHNVLSEPLLRRQLRSPNPYARAAATRLLRWSKNRIPDALTLLRQQANDKHPRVRLHAVVAASAYASAEAAEVALEILKHPTDYYLDYALTETMRVLAPQAKAAIAAGKPFGAGNPKGVEYLWKATPTRELLAMPSSVAVEMALLARSDVSAKRRRSALERLAKANNSTPLAELLRIMEHADSKTKALLLRLLPDWDPSELAARRAVFESIAQLAVESEVRQAALAALITTDRSVERAWTLVAQTRRGLLDLLAVAPEFGDLQLRAALYPKIKLLLRGLPSSRAATTAREKGVRGRFVRIDLPGDKRTLTLAEVEVFADGKNIAPTGKASQSSTAYGGEAQRAIDGNTSGAYGDGGQTHTAENTRDPWWELDLGKEQFIEAIALWNRTENAGQFASRLNRFTISVLDVNREVVFQREHQPAPLQRVLFEIPTPDPDAPIRVAAIRALAAIPDREAETFDALADLIVSGIEPTEASAAIGAIPRDRWPRERLGAIADALIASASKMSVARRATPEFEGVLEFGRQLASVLPAIHGEKIRSGLDRLAVQVVWLKTVPGEMKFDREEITVETGRPVAMFFHNDCLMPHNWVMVAPNAAEEIGNAVDAMNEEDPLRAEKMDYVPKSSKVLYFTKVISPGETARLYFDPPPPDDYPYICTFPGHWRSMNGILRVVAPR